MSRHFPPDQVGTDRYIITDPLSQDGLTPIVSKGEIPTHYDNQYVAETEVRCAFCPQHQRHKHGYTAVMEDGRRALIGIDCGREHFGSFRASALRRKLRDDTQHRLRADLLAQARQGLPLLIEAMTTRWVGLERVVGRFMGQLPRITQASTDGRMDQGAHYLLGRIETRVRRRPDGLEVPEQVFVETGRVTEIRTVWAQRGQLGDALTLAQNLQFSAARMEVTGKVDHDALMEQRRMLIERLREGISWLERAKVFLAPDNVERYGQAVRKVGGHDRLETKERRGGMVLRVRPADGAWKTFDFPDLSVVPMDADLVGLLLGTEASG